MHSRVGDLRVDLRLGAKNGAWQKQKYFRMTRRGIEKTGGNYHDTKNSSIQGEARRARSGQKRRNEMDR
jgi:hypothetical protein